jgi:magnesium chelatase accessory protein
MPAARQSTGQSYSLAESDLRNRLEKWRWPGREHSQFINAASVAFHVQTFGQRDAPLLLFVHGTGASTHSMQRLAAEFASTRYCILIDLPGHGFSALPAGFPPTLPDMARAVGALIVELGIEGSDAIGHSAGAAVLIALAERQPQTLGKILTLNAALEPMRGQSFWSPLAKGLFMNPLTPQLFAWRAKFGGMTRIMLRATGTHLDEEMLAQYQLLLEDADHVRGALAMMASWDLAPLQASLPQLQNRLILAAAEDDTFIPPAVSRDAAKLAQNGTYVSLGAGGHLVHEMQAKRVAAALRSSFNTA